MAYGIRIGRVMLDRGFYDVSVVDLLKKSAKYLIPAKRTTAIKRAIIELEERGEFITEYTMKSG
ncbi:MAG: hypothetical protein SVM80_06835, partial [Halobacteriota archaeon]|nr:hypothetical protein [Halobacteriota archaeon]